MTAELFYAARALLRDRWAAFGVVTTLTVGLGLNIATFTYVDAVLLRPLPYSDPDRLAVVWAAETLAQRPAIPSELYGSRIRAATSATHVSAFQLLPQWATLQHGATREVIRASAVGEPIFETLGVRPILGRTFADLSVSERARAVVLSYSLWNARFARSQDAIGSSILINDQPFTVVGIMPRDFFFPDTSVRLWILLRDDEPFQAIARLREGVSLEQLHTEVNRDADAGPRIGVFSYFSVFVGEHERATLALLGIVTALLAAACVNVSIWLLARALMRSREIAVRLTLGISPSHLAAAAFAEPLVLVAVSSVAALIFAYGALHLIRWLTLADIPRIEQIALNLRAFGYACGVSVAVTGLVALLPLGHALRARPATLLSSRAARQLSATSAMRGLVMLEVGASIVLLVLAGLLAASFVRFRSIDYGFRPKNVVVAQISIPARGIRTPGGFTDTVNTILDEIASISGVERASAAYSVPLRPSRWEPAQISVAGVRRDAGVWIIGPDYFSVLGVPVLEGREFTPEDTQVSQRVAVVSRGFAREVWGTRSPVGRQFIVLRVKAEVMRKMPQGLIQDMNSFKRIVNDSASYEPAGPPWTVVGVVENVRMFGLAETSRSMIYLPYAQRYDGFDRAMILIRRADGAKSVDAVMRARIERAEPASDVIDVFTMDHAIESSIGGAGSLTLLTYVSSLIAAFSLTLVVSGVYAVASLARRRRQTELAIRRALGASPLELLVQLGGRDLAQIVAATLVGLVTATLATRAIASLLVGVMPVEPTTYSAVAVTVLIACVATWLAPLWKLSSREDLASLLKQE